VKRAAGFIPAGTSPAARPPRDTKGEKALMNPQRLFGDEDLELLEFPEQGLIES
jgi:hypothetical protein